VAKTLEEIEKKGEVFCEEKVIVLPALLVTELPVAQ